MSKQLFQNDNGDHQSQFVVRSTKAYSILTMPDRDDELTDAKIAAAEARGDTKLARMEGKLDTFSTKVDGRFDALFDKLNVMQSQQAGTKATIIVTAIASVVAILGVLIGVLAYGGDQLGRGMEVRKAVDEAIQETIRQLPKQPVTIETDGSKQR
ncbi:MAG: hypothetical protein ACK4JB_20055 [Reyranella sp.]